MRLVVTNAHKNPIVFEAPWLFAEDEEAWLDLTYETRSGKSERLMINIPHSLKDREPVAVVTIGVEKVGDGEAEFFVDVSSDAEESTERVYSRFLPEDSE